MVPNGKSSSLSSSPKRPEGNLQVERGQGRKRSKAQIFQMPMPLSMRQLRKFSDWIAAGQLKCWAMTTARIT